MAAKKYVVIKDSNFGKKGAIVEKDGELTERQKVMLKPYDEPKVSKAK